ncbi:MAG: hypothetical protein JXQ76_11765 [Campylobacterales bacterium]|nr:hypothetical protein [Campylobacterales bacterium]
MEIIGYLLTAVATVAGLFSFYLGIFAARSLIEVSYGDITKIFFAILIVLFFLGVLLLPLYAVSLIDQERYFLSYIYNIVLVLVNLFLIYATIMGIVTIKN